MCSRNLLSTQNFGWRTLPLQLIQSQHYHESSLRQALVVALADCLTFFWRRFGTGSDRHRVRMRCCNFLQHHGQSQQKFHVAVGMRDTGQLWKGLVFLQIRLSVGNRRMWPSQTPWFYLWPPVLWSHTNHLKITWFAGYKQKDKLFWTTNKAPTYI